MTDYLPEGRLIQRAENRLWVESIDSLAEAMHQKTVIEAVAERCDSEKNLHVRLGHWQGVIPRDETALGLREGTLREIAVLARVGKPVGFQVIGLEANDGRLTPLLSRRAAQRSALNHLRSLPRGAILNATVTRLESFGAFVEIAPGKDGLIHISKLDNRRVEKVEDVLNIGDMTWVKVIEIDDKGRINLSRRDAIAEINARGGAKPGELIR